MERLACAISDLRSIPFRREAEIGDAALACGHRENLIHFFRTRDTSLPLGSQVLVNEVTVHVDFQVSD